MAQLEIRELSPTVGAEVVGFDPNVDVDAVTWMQLSKAFDKYGVLVFRDMKIDPATQHKLAEVLYAGGDLSKIPTDKNEKFSLVSNREKDGGSPYGRLLYHADMMWSDVADQVPTLFAVEVEQPSTPTTFVSTTHGWKTLPADLRARLEKLHARHQSGQQGRGNSAYEEELIQPQWETLNDTTTPVGLAHPRTGEIMLYVGEQHTREIVELPKEESDALLDELFAHLYKPENVFEHHWRTGDLVAWDNQAVQHGRPYVKGDGPARTLRKIHAPSNIMERYGKSPSYAKAAM
jgi:alpha-ketoglutarate-dependent taurine dioxygenase